MRSLQLYQQAPLPDIISFVYLLSKDTFYFDMVRFKIILETIRDFNLLNNVFLLSKINQLEEEFPAFVTNTRGLGLLRAFDLPSGIERDL